MDSFTMLFESPLAIPEVTQALQSAGFSPRVQGLDTIFVADGEASVWVHITRPDDLNSADLEDEDEWPIRRNQLGALLTLTVRRTAESEALAIRIAHCLVRKREGMILWDGMDQWAKKYEAFVRGK